MQLRDLEFEITWPGARLRVGARGVPVGVESPVSADDLFELAKWAQHQAHQLIQKDKERTNA